MNGSELSTRITDMDATDWVARETESLEDSLENAEIRIQAALSQLSEQKDLLLEMKLLNDNALTRLDRKL